MRICMFNKYYTLKITPQHTRGRHFQDKFITLRKWDELHENQGNSPAAPHSEQ